METLQIAANGWEYTVEVDANGKIVCIACKGRFPLTKAEWIGNDWMVQDLQNRVDNLRNVS